MVNSIMWIGVAAFAVICFIISVTLQKQTPKNLEEDMEKINVQMVS